MYTVYSWLTAAGMILLSPYFLIRGLMNGKYLRHVTERLGWKFPAELESGGNDAVWIHAVSVGEVLAALPLAMQLKQAYPERRLVISTTTTTGQQLARQRLQCADAIFYFPLDWKGPVTRAIRAARPGTVIIVETEIWPNFLRECRRAHVPVVFVNGRLSERSYRGFVRALTWSGGMLRNFLKRILDDATLFLMQSEQDAARLLKLGADPTRVIVAGNLKYDLAKPPETPLSAWLQKELAMVMPRPVLVAGSVMANEEVQVLRAFADVQREFPNVLLVLAPRKPDRFDAAAQIISESGQTLVRRRDLSHNEAGNSALAKPGTVLLLDSLGELADIYRLADVVFVGGSLVPSGGHNILEPAAFSKVPIYGPSMENFREMAVKFLEAGAAIQVKDPQELGEAWKSLLRDTGRAERMGAAARGLVDRNNGATARVLRHIAQIVDSSRGQK